MATLISCATGDMSAAATWALVDATSVLDAETSQSNLSTGYSETPSFTPGAITIDGIAVKVAYRGGSTGTMSVRLAQGGTLVAGTEITINVSDLDPGPDSNSRNQGWILFKFAAPVTLAAATAYTVSAKVSVNLAVTLMRGGASSSDYSRMLRTTTTQAPAAGDSLHIIGEHTGAGTGNSFVVDMDSTASTDYGPGTDGAAAMTVGKRGTLQFKYAASMNYYLKLSGDLVVYSGGTFTIGTVANPIPRTSTAVLEFDPVATGGMGLQIRGGATVTMQGLSRSSGKNIYYCLLNTDEAAGQTTLGVDTDTGWLNGDEIVIASTSRTPGDSEARTLNADAGASSISVSAGLTNAHSGTSPTQAEVINLTRNVIVRSADSAKMTFVTVGAGNSTPSVTVDIDWVRFRYCGSGASTPKAGLYVNMQSGATGPNIQFSSWDGHTGTAWYSVAAIPLTMTLSNNVVSYLANTLTSGQQGLDLAGGTGSVTSGNVLIGANTGGRQLITRDQRGVAASNRVAGVSGFPIWMFGAAYQAVAAGSHDGNVAHSSAQSLTLSALGPGEINGLKGWRNGAAGACSGLMGVVLSDLLMFGNSTNHVTFSTCSDVTLLRPVLAGDSSFATPRGIFLTDSGRPVIRIIDGQLGVASGIYVAHSTSDLYCGSANSAGEPQVILHNTVLGSTTEVESQGNLQRGAVIGAQKHDGTVGNHKSWKAYGTITRDTTAGLYRTSSPSERLAPNTASFKLTGSVKRFAVASGASATVSVYVRESVVGDGTDYAGNRARLVLKANPAAGVASDTVLATATVSSEGAFELISGTTPAVTDDAVLEVYVDCDGTTGWVNVDDYSVA